MGTFLSNGLEIVQYRWLLHGNLLAARREYYRLQAGWHIVLERTSMWQWWNTGYFYGV